MPHAFLAAPAKKVSPRASVLANLVAIGHMSLMNTWNNDAMIVKYT